MTGVSLGIAMANRNFVCILCKRDFSRVTGDLILAEESICDDCLEELSKMDEKAVRAYISQHLDGQELRNKETKNRLLKVVSRLLTRTRRLEELVKRVEKRETGK